MQLCLLLQSQLPLLSQSSGESNFKVIQDTSVQAHLCRGLCSFSLPCLCACALQSVTPQRTKTSDMLVSKCLCTTGEWCTYSSSLPIMGSVYHPDSLCWKAPVVRMWFFPQILLCGLSTSVFKEKPVNSNADRQTYRAAILMSHARGTTPAAEVLSLHKALA